MAKNLKEYCLLAGLIYFVVIVSISNAQDKPVTDICLGCICEAISGCNLTARCNGDVCGPFRITWPYWADGGKLTLNNEAPESQTGYANCSNDPYCAASTIQNYMTRFGQDCNGDGAVNCYDYAAIHKLGGYGCKGQLDYKYYTTLDDCLKYHQNGAGQLDVRQN